MIKSIGLDYGIDLTAGESYQLLINNVTDVNLTEDERSISKAYPSHEGWDPFYGYGRLNVEAAAVAVVEGRIPPSVSISYPEWFEVIVPDSTPVVDIEASIDASRTGSFSWTLEVGYGHDPSFTVVETGAGGSTFSGVLTTLDVSSLPEISMPEPEYDDTIRERLARVNEPAVTVRLVWKMPMASSPSNEKHSLCIKTAVFLQGFHSDSMAQVKPRLFSTTWMAIKTLKSLWQTVEALFM